MQQVFDMTFHHVMSSDILAGVVSRCLPSGLWFKVPFSHDGCVCFTGMVSAPHAKPTAGST